MENETTELELKDIDADGTPEVLAIFHGLTTRGYRFNSGHWEEFAITAHKIDAARNKQTGEVIAITEFYTEDDIKNETHWDAMKPGESEQYPIFGETIRKDIHIVTYTIYGEEGEIETKNRRSFLVARDKYFGDLLKLNVHSQILNTENGVSDKAKLKWILFYFINTRLKD
jgi:hypothetical protein